MEKIKIGDIVFFCDNSLLSRAIRLVETGKTGQKVPSHVAIVSYILPDDIGLIEVHSTSVRKTFLSSRKKSTMWFARMKEPRNTEKGMNWLADQLGKRYDYSQIIGIWLRSFFRILGKGVYERVKLIRNYLNTRQAFICSELVEIYSGETGKRLWPRADISETTPYDQFRSEEIEFYETEVLYGKKSTRRSMLNRLLGSFGVCL